MSSLPLPALAIRPPAQPTDPLEQFSRLQAIRSSMMGQQLQQQQLQGASQENQIRQIQLQDTQAASQAMRDWDGKDINDLPGLYLKHGASAQAILGLRSNIVDFQQKLGNAQKTDLENFKSKNDYIAGQLDSVAQLKDPAKISSALDDLGQNDEFRKMLSPQEQAQLPQIIQGLKQMAAQGGDVAGQLTELRNHHLADSQMADLAQKQQQTATSAQQQATSAQEAQTSKATQAKTEQETENLKEGGNQALADARYRNIQTQIAQGQKVAPSDQAFVTAYEKQKTLTPAFNFRMESGQGPQLPLNPQQSATAQAILEGRMDPPGSFALKTPYWQQVMGEVFRQDPQWNEQRHELRKDFTLGKGATQINAINTALQHTGVLGDSIDALKNGNVQVLNQLANNIGVQVGKTPQTTFETIVGRLGPELASAYAVGTGGERASIEQGLSPKMSPDQLKTNLGTNVQLLNGKINSLRNQWDQNKGAGMPAFDDRFITPEAKAVIGKWQPQAPNQPGGGHIIRIGTKRYQYTGSGDTADLKSYTELPETK